jgi:hypothetical protein
MAYTNLQRTIEAVAIYQGNLKWYFLTHNVIYSINKLLIRKTFYLPSFSQINFQL